MELAMLLAVAGILWWIWQRYERSQKMIAACAHEFEYISAWNEGVYWCRNCKRCPFQEPVRDPDLLERLRRDHRN